MDARKLKERATEAFAKGKFLKAAEAYAEYCAAEPKDAQSRLRMGDAWSKAGQKPKAIAAYQAAAETFAKDGFLPRAIAASKLILELDPSHKGVQQMLANLYAQKTGGAATSGHATSKPSAGAAAVAAAVELKVDTPVRASAAAEVSAPLPVTVTRPVPPAPLPPPAAEIDFGLDTAAAPAVVVPPPAAPVAVATVEPAPAAEIDFGLAVAAPPAVVAAVEIPSSAGTPDETDFSDVAPPPSAPGAQAAADRAPPSKPLPSAASTAKVASAANRAPKVYDLDLDAPEAPAAGTESSGDVEITIDPSPSAPGPAVSRVAPPGMSPPAFAVEVVGPPPQLEVMPGPVSAAASEEPIPASSLAAGPPGLKPRKREAGAQDARIWLPQGFTAPPPSAPAAVSSGGGHVASMPGPHHASPQTDLEKSLEAFSKFDVDAGPAAPAPVPRVPSVMLDPVPAGFTELELEGDSFLHAVEEAALAGMNSRGQVPAPAVVEESLAHDEPKVEQGALPKIPLFSDLPEDAFIALFEKCPLRRFGVGEIIIAQGSQGKSFFVICAGSVKVFRTENGERRDLARLDEGAFFGEMALLSADARTASVESNDEDTQLLEISAAILAELSEKYSTVATALKKFCRQRLLQNVMGSSPLFAPFSRGDRRTLVEKFRAREVNKGDLIIRQGDKSDGLYVVLSGEVAVSAGGAQLATLKEGEIFGEMSLLTKQPAGANVIALRRTSLLRLPKEDFDRLILSHPQILVLVSELTDERKKQNASLPVVPSGDEPLV